MTVLAVDPGTLESGWCLFSDSMVRESGVLPNADMLHMLRSYSDDDENEVPLLPVSERPLLAIEMIASYGMPVGREVFETCVHIGRMIEAWGPAQHRLVYRKDVKMHLCGTNRAKDPHVRQALIDKLGPVGVKKAPGPLYGVKSHAWAALAVAVTAAETANAGAVS